MKRPRPASLLRRLTLQGRFALLAALGVAIAVVAASVICYFLVQNHLEEQVNSQILPSAGGPPGASGNFNLGGNGNPQPGHGPGFDSKASTIFADCEAKVTQFEPVNAVTNSSGVTCSTAHSRFALPTTASPEQIAVAQGKQATAVYDTYTTSGEHVRVYTYTPPGESASGYSYSSVTSLAYLDSSLHSLAIELTIAALGGILLAAASGFLVARSALAPVRRLTKAAEHVAKTDDLSIQLPVDGADELSRLGKAFNRMTRSLAGSRERQQRLIADAGHELRTPLTSLRTNVDLLLRSRRTGRALPPGRERAMLESVDQQLHELSGLVTDLLELSRNIEAGKRKTMQVALHESVGRAVERARLRGPGLEFDVEIEPWFVQGDPTGLDRAVVNLLDNAVKFSPPSGQIAVRLRRGIYTVRDQGPGISPEDLPRVFERFYRSDSARQLPGSGLGLAIVAQVAEETGGTIRLLPAPGGGTLARLALPGGPDDRSIGAAPTPPTPPAAPTPPSTPTRPTA